MYAQLKPDAMPLIAELFDEGINGLVPFHEDDDNGVHIALIKWSHAMVVTRIYDSKRKLTVTLLLDVISHVGYKVKEETALILSPRKYNSCWLDVDGTDSDESESNY